MFYYEYPCSFHEDLTVIFTHIYIIIIANIRIIMFIHISITNICVSVMFIHYRITYIANKQYSTGTLFVKFGIGMGEVIVTVGHMVQSHLKGIMR